MQTFLPYRSFTESLACLDNKRLGKQRVEAMQILRALEDPNYGWQNHPAVKMWRMYNDTLKIYYNYAILVWKAKGFKNTMLLEPIITQEAQDPHWLTDDFCRAHQSNLLRKDYDYYKQFGWNVPDNLPYIWPEK